MRRWHSYTALFIVLMSVLYLVMGFEGKWDALFMTPDQKGYRHFQQGDYKAAADAFEDPMFKGVALYKAGEFKQAQMVLSVLTSKEGRFDYGNALFMGGAYDKAIEAYGLALKIDPEFLAAKENLALAKARKAEIERHRDNDEGTGGRLAADEIRFDNKNDRGQEIVEEGSKGRSVGEARWLDRLQTSPGEFLKNKFAYQYQMQGVEDAP